jgi:hypothetical protein
MLSTRVFGLACSVAVFVCLMAAPASAQPLDKRTLFTFSAPVALPGVTLPAGQYLFRLADPNSATKVVQVLNADGTKPYGLFFTLPAERFEPATTPEVRFMETASGTTAAIRTWWMGALAVGGAQVSQPTRDTYTWAGEFVSVDTTAMKMTVKSRVAYQEAVSELKRFTPDQPVWVVWSGIDHYSDAVREVRRVEANRKIDENLVLPAELASAEAPNQYITIRVRVPEGSLTVIKAVKPGEWVTVTSRHRPSTDTKAVVAVKPYASDTTTN